MSIQPVILCGGTRIWPLSRKAFRKQFVSLLDNKILLQLALERVAHLSSYLFISKKCLWRTSSGRKQLQKNSKYLFQPVYVTQPSTPSCMGKPASSSFFHNQF